MFTVIHMKGGFSRFGMRAKLRVVYHLRANHGEICDRITKKNPKTPQKEKKREKKGKKAQWATKQICMVSVWLNYSRYTIAAAEGLSEYLITWK